MFSILCNQESTGSAHLYCRLRCPKAVYMVTFIDSYLNLRPYIISLQRVIPVVQACGSQQEYMIYRFYTSGFTYLFVCFPSTAIFLLDLLSAILSATSNLDFSKYNLLLQMQRLHATNNPNNPTMDPPQHTFHYANCDQSQLDLCLQNCDLPRQDPRPTCSSSMISPLPSPTT